MATTLFRLTARLQIYCSIILYHSKYDNPRHILYKISLKMAKVKCPRLGTSDRFFAKILLYPFSNFYALSSYFYII